MPSMAPLARSNCFQDTAVALLGQSIARTRYSALVMLLSKSDSVCGVRRQGGIK
jgi:hypothetical protein